MRISSVLAAVAAACSSVRAEFVVPPASHVPIKNPVYIVGDILSLAWTLDLNKTDPVNVMLWESGPKEPNNFYLASLTTANNLDWEVSRRGLKSPFVLAVYTSGNTTSQFASHVFEIRDSASSSVVSSTVRSTSSATSSATSTAATSTTASSTPTQSSDPSTGTSSTGLGAGPIAGIAVGAVAAVALIGAALFFALRRRGGGGGAAATTPNTPATHVGSPGLDNVPKYAGQVPPSQYPPSEYAHSQYPQQQQPGNNGGYYPVQSQYPQQYGQQHAAYELDPTSSAHMMPNTPMSELHGAASPVSHTVHGSEAGHSPHPPPSSLSPGH